MAQMLGNYSNFSIRINTLKISVQQCISSLHADGWDFETVDWCDHALIIAGDKKQFFESRFVTDGCCYIQSLSSLIPGLLLDPQPGDTVLDLCAAPGGKTMHLAALMQNTGAIVANDVSRPRMYKAKHLFNQYGVTNVEISQTKGEFLWKTYTDHFDRALVDVPCSMGQVYANKNLRRLAQRQKYLLKSAFTSLKPGGTLVYSTCTITHQENQDVVNWLLKQCSDALVIKPDISDELTPFLTSEGYLEIKDSAIFDPFFIAAIRKN